MHKGNYNVIDRAQICPGNPDPEMAELFERRGHCTIDDNHHAVAYIDVEDVTNSDEVPYNSPQ